MTAHVLVHNGELYAEGERTDICPYCDLPVSGEIVAYGGPMHKNCYLRFGEEMDEVYPDDDRDWVQPEEETDILLLMQEAEEETPAEEEEPVENPEYPF
jgi:hypothetical protein